MSTAWLTRAPSGAATPFFSAAELTDVGEWYRRAALPPTPLRRLPALAGELGLGDLLIKDETGRFGLPSFKILGAHYAVGQLVSRHGPALTDLACATAGNHGLAVASAGASHGLEVHVSVPIGTAPRAVDAIRAAGAHVVVTSVDYDATVALMADEAGEYGWTVVSDTAYGPDEAMPRAIMAGYTRLLDEACAAWDDVPDVIVVQAGVGSLAASVAGWLQASFPDAGRRPRLIVAEPEGAACVLQSLRAGCRTDLETCAPTMMTGLRCGRVSPAAWPALEAGVDAAIAVSESQCRAALSALERPAGTDPAIAAGPAGACGVAALLALCADPDLTAARRAVGLTARSRCLAIVTERAPGPLPAHG